MDQLPDIEKDNLTEIEIRLDVERRWICFGRNKEAQSCFLSRGLKQKKFLIYYI